jgi:DNA processing protein
MTARALSDSERLAWLRLARTENVGAATFTMLMSRFPNVGQAYPPRRRGMTEPLVECLTL